MLNLNRCERQAYKVLAEEKAFYILTRIISRVFIGFFLEASLFVIVSLHLTMWSYTSTGASLNCFNFLTLERDKTENKIKNDSPFFASCFLLNPYSL